MVKLILCLTLFVLVGCAGGSSYNQTRERGYIPVYDAEGNPTWVNQMGPTRKDRRGRPDNNYMDYNTGEIYYPVGENMYMDSNGELYQSY